MDGRSEVDEEEESEEEEEEYPRRSCLVLVGEVYCSAMCGRAERVIGEWTGGDVLTAVLRRRDCRSGDEDEADDEGCGAARARILLPLPCILKDLTTLLAMVGMCWQMVFCDDNSNSSNPRAPASSRISSSDCSCPPRALRKSASNTRRAVDGTEQGDRKRRQASGPRQRQAEFKNRQQRQLTRASESDCDKLFLGTLPFADLGNHFGLIGVRQHIPS